jgi:predicted permease
MKNQVEQKMNTKIKLKVYFHKILFILITFYLALQIFYSWIKLENEHVKFT